MAKNPVIPEVYRKLGGRKVLGQELNSEADLARVVTRGVPLQALEHFTRGGFSEQEVAEYVIPPRTRRHRQRRKERLTIEESEKLVRLARIQALAEDVFQDPDKANRWLRQPLGILGRIAPLEFARTEPGARVIEQILGKIEWGAAA
jgi:putative toxin-antitoxin system antitoxin component (TIGR02293 family)